MIFFNDRDFVPLFRETKYFFPRSNLSKIIVLKELNLENRKLKEFDTKKWQIETTTKSFRFKRNLNKIAK